MSISLPTDGSPVLDLPAGFDFDCSDGTVDIVVDNVFQGSAVSPPDPHSIPTLSPAGLLVFAAGLLGFIGYYRRRF